MARHLPLPLRAKILSFVPLKQLQLWDVTDPNFLTHDLCREWLRQRYQLTADQVHAYYDHLVEPSTSSRLRDQNLREINSGKKFPIPVPIGLLTPILALVKIGVIFDDIGHYSNFFAPASVAILLAIRQQDEMLLQIYLAELVAIQKNLCITEAIALIQEALLTPTLNCLQILLVSSVLPSCQGDFERQLAIIILEMNLSSVQKKALLAWAQSKKMRRLANLLHLEDYELEIDKWPNLATFNSVLIRHLHGYELPLYGDHFCPSIITAKMVADVPNIIALLQGEDRVKDGHGKSFYLDCLSLIQGVIPAKRDYPSFDMQVRLDYLALALGLLNVHAPGMISGTIISDVFYCDEGFKRIYAESDDDTDPTGGQNVAAELMMFNCWRIGRQVNFLALANDAQYSLLARNTESEYRDLFDQLQLIIGYSSYNKVLGVRATATIGAKIIRWANLGLTISMGYSKIKSFLPEQEEK